MQWPEDKNWRRFFKPSEEDYEDEGDDILEEPVSDQDAHCLKVFCNKVDHNVDGWYLSTKVHSPWFDKRYAIPMDKMRGACGRETNNHVLWDVVAESACRGRLDDYRIRPTTREQRQCALCSMTRETSAAVEVAGVSYPIGANCARLVQAVHEFYQTLSNIVLGPCPLVDMYAHVQRLDRAMAAVQEMHAKK
jgi:hypothetical protein